jgi:hypothetical protein
MGKIGKAHHRASYNPTYPVSGDFPPVTVHASDRPQFLFWAL